MDALRDRTIRVDVPFLEEPMVHLHKCPRCSHVWKHDLASIPEEKLKVAHTCPECGFKGVTNKHEDRELLETLPLTIYEAS